MPEGDAVTREQECMHESITVVASVVVCNGIVAGIGKADAYAIVADMVILYA